MNATMKDFMPMILAVVLVMAVMRVVWWHVQPPVAQQPVSAVNSQYELNEVLQEVLKLGGIPNE